MLLSGAFIGGLIGFMFYIVYAIFSGLSIASGVLGGYFTGGVYGSGGSVSFVTSPFLFVSGGVVVGLTFSLLFVKRGPG